MITKKYITTGLLMAVFLILLFYAILAQRHSTFLSTKPLISPKYLPSLNSAESFTVVALPDTQVYALKYPDIFCRQTEWIIANQNKLNIAFVSQLGDIVNDGRVESQWKTASACLGKLDGKVPYGIIPGNHDLDVTNDLASGYHNYNAFFPAERYEKYYWYKGNYKGNQNNYQIIRQNGQTLMFLNLEYDPGDGVIGWAQAVVDKYPEAYTILTTHMYLPLDVKTRDETRERLWQELIYKNCSIKMVWSGHYHGESRLSSRNSCGQAVEQITQDFQGRENGGDGLLRLYIFTPAAGKIDVYTYLSTQGAFNTEANNRFTVPFLP